MKALDIRPPVLMVDAVPFAPCRCADNRRRVSTSEIAEAVRKALEGETIDASSFGSEHREVIPTGEG